jgi:hypothetical protein
MASAAQFILSARASFFSFLRLNGGTCGRSSVFEHQSAQYWKAEKRHLEGERKIRALRRSTDFDDQAGRFYEKRFGYSITSIKINHLTQFLRKKP